MDGKNASGRRVSLLNESVESTELPLRLPSISPSLQSRTSSYISSPIGSPPIPQLIRSDSSDSTAMQSPSPTTPEFLYDPNQPNTIIDDDAAAYGHQGFFPPQQKQLNSPYPPLPHNPSLLPYNTPDAYLRQHPYRHAQGVLQQQQQQQQQLSQPIPQSLGLSQAIPQTHSSTRPESEPRPNGTASNVRSKKNSYPCPMAKTFNCNDYFTTSGHAARHAKKHTGRKDALCPECNKAFTRKDNMEQHRRTHANGRNASKGTESAAKKAKQQAKRPKPTVLQTIAPPLAQLNTMMVDPNLPTDATFAMSPNEPFSQYPDPTQNAMSPYSLAPNFPVGSYHGLDALAQVATGEQRKYDH